MKQPHHLTVALTALLLSAGLPSVWGQQSASSAQFVQSAQATQSRLAIQSLTEEILAIDGEIERRVNQLVSMMVGVTDSTDSGRKIANQKEELMQGLKRSIDWYRQERAKRQSDLTAGYQRVPAQDLEKGIEVLDEKVEKRIEQILAVSASLAGHKDIKKYEQSYDSWDGEWDRRVSDEYRQNKRVSGKTTRAQEDIRKGLERSSQQLDQERADLQRRITITRDPETRAVLEKQLARTEETIARRRDQTVETFSGSSATAGRTVSSREATSMDRLMRDMVEEIQHDFRRLEGLVNQLSVERQRLNQLSYR